MEADSLVAYALRCLTDADKVQTKQDYGRDSMIILTGVVSGTVWCISRLSTKKYGTVKKHGIENIVVCTDFLTTKWYVDV